MGYIPEKDYDQREALHELKRQPRPLGPELPDFKSDEHFRIHGDGSVERIPLTPPMRPLMERVVTPPEWGEILDSIAFKGMLFVCFEKAGVCVLTKEGTFVKLVPEAAHVSR